MNDRDRIRAYLAFNDLPLEKWFSFGDICVACCLAPRKVRVFLSEAKRQGAFEKMEDVEVGLCGSFNTAWKRTKEVEMPK